MYQSQGNVGKIMAEKAVDIIHSFNQWETFPIQRNPLFTQRFFHFFLESFHLIRRNIERDAQDLKFLILEFILSIVEIFHLPQAGTAPSGP